MTRPPDPAWWTALRAAIILMCGGLSGWFLSPLYVTAPEPPARQSSDPGILAGLVSLERDIGARLAAQAGEMQRRLDDFRCTAEEAALTPQAAPALPTLPRSPATVSRLRDIAEHAVVFIQADDGSGTGFFVTPTRIATNAHVVGASREVLIFAGKLYGQPIRGRVLDSTAERGENLANRDYAIIEVTAAPDVRPLPLAQSVTELDTVISAGFPGLFQSFQQTGLPRMILRSGEFIHALPQADGREVYAHSAEVFQGNSGGPLLNACGEVVGMNTFIIWSSPSETEASPQVKTDFALPAPDLARYLADHGITASQAPTACSPQ